MIRMDRGPLVKIKCVVEYVAVNQTDDIDPFFENGWQILQKEERRGVIILVLDTVVNDQLDCRDLVVPKSIINGWAVVEFTLMAINKLIPGQLLTFWNRVFVEERELAVEVVVKLLIEEIFHGSAVEW
jgi:hypothetical protein